ncbi:UNVERIFIED_CONTAM: hypothetical protein DES50_109176 [Williamsia faeni]
MSRARAFGRYVPSVRGPVPKVVVASMVSVVLIASCGSTDTPSPSGVRVETTGNGFLLDGDPWWPTGLNAYQLGTDWSVNEGCGAQVDLDAYFKALPDSSITRFDLYSSMAVDKDTGHLDFGPLDAVFDAAQRHDQLLVPVLASGEGACEDLEFKDRDWYEQHWDEPGAVATGADAKSMSYAQWLDTAVGRWGGRSSLAGWELMGEPETSYCGNDSCAWQDRKCPDDAAAVLRTFFDAAGARLRALDPDTPIWAGLAGGGQCGSQGQEYEFVARSDGIDVLDYHDYGPVGVPIPGDPDNGLARRIAQATAVGKPLIVAEIGEEAGSCRTLSARAADLKAKVDAQRTAGTAGALFWSFVPDPRPDECTLDIGPGDPLFGLLGKLPDQSSTSASTR